MAKVMIPTPLRKFTQQQSSVETQAADVRGALEELAQQYPDLKKHLFDEQGRVRSYVNLFVGDQNVRDLQGVDTQVAEQQTISIIPAIAGGRLL